SLNEAAARTWDAVVVGAGPAGSLAARQLARAGLGVLLVDRASFPRWKVCGCCLSAGALATLRAVGLGDLARERGGVPLGRVRVAAGARSSLLPLPGGMALSREAFDTALVEASLAAGASFLPRTQARALPAGDPATRPLLLSQDGGAAVVSARVLLAADGLG